MTYQPTVKELRQLIGNPDAYAVQHKDGSWTPVRDEVTGSVLRKHREGAITIGTYVVQPPNLARTLVFDVDDPSGAAQRDQVKAIAAVLDTLGLNYGIEESGRKGYHVWVVAETYLDAGVLARLGRGVREEVGLPKLEVFPKQAETRDLGNLVKLPGGVHAVTGNLNWFLTDGDVPLAGTGFPGANDVGYLETVAEQYPELRMRKAGGGQAIIEYPCVARIQEGVEEGGRNIALFHLATMLRKWSLSDENVETIVRRADAAGDPLEEAELAALLDSSRNSGPICSQLSDDLNCGEQCIMAKHAGLYTRAGNLAYAPVGQGVVLEVASRTEEGTTIELKHPDAAQVRAVLSSAPRRKGGKRE